MTERRLTFVPKVDAAPAPRQGSVVVVLDPTWTPVMGDRPDVLSARQVLGRVVERVDLFDGALVLVDAWAAKSGIADTLIVEDTTYWFRLREPMWRWVHERLLWRLAIGELERQGAVDAVELLADDPALADVIRARWPDAAVSARTVEGGASTSTATRSSASTASPIARLGRLLTRREPRIPKVANPAPLAAPEERQRRERILADRVDVIAGDERRRVVVLTNPGTHQRIGDSTSARVDPLFGGIIPGLEAGGDLVVLLATGIDQRRDDDWAIVADDGRMLPQFLLRTRWADADDDARAERALEATSGAIDAASSTSVDLDRLDLTSAFVDGLRSAATQIIRTDVQMLARIERLIDELRPASIVLAQEGIRTPWLMAAHAAGVPVVAVQHGVLYAGHAGYPDRRHPALRLPTRTCVYGRSEREVLLDLAYEPDEVVVTGSPRLDLDTLRMTGDDAAERAAVRQELGVADSDRLVVVSTINLRFIQRSHFAHMLEALFSPPPIGVHVVFKQHPGEREAGPYRELLAGLARAETAPAPPISVVKDIDLYRLLRAADAHLGLLSTVLTEAVVTGTPNLIAMTDAHSDLLGYVEAGVATPVRTAADLRAALERLAAPDAATRRAFLDRHFRPGDAGARIIEVIDSVAVPGAVAETL